MTARLCMVGGFAAISLFLTVSSRGEEFLPPEYAPAENPTTMALPHLVIEATRPRKHPKHAIEETIIYDDAWNASHEPPAEEPQHVKFHEKLHDKVAPHFLHADKTPRPVAIPNANRVPVWKAPYSYGHFGASRNRHWSFHNGHQQTFSQWTFR